MINREDTKSGRNGLLDYLLCLVCPIVIPTEALIGA